MRKPVIIGAACAGAAVCFCAGRMTSPAAVVVKEQRPSRSSDRSQTPRAYKITGPGAGDQAITHAMDLRAIFKANGTVEGNGVAKVQAALSKMNATEVASLVADLADAQANTPGYSYSLEISTACERWAELDPEAALRFVLSAKQASFRSAALSRLFSGIAKADPALARAKAANLPDAAQRRTAMAGILSTLSVSQPDEWMDAIKDDPSQMRHFSLGSIAAEWAVDDPAVAAARLLKLPPGMEKGAFAAVAKVWAGSDPKAAMAWAASLANASQRDEALGAAAGGIAAQDPEAALNALSALGPAARSAGLGSIFHTLADLDFDAAVTRIGSLDARDQATAMKALLGNGESYFDYPGQRTAEQLNALAAQLPPGSLRSQALGQLGGALASLSPGDCDRVLQGYTGAERTKLQSAMLQNLSYNDPVRALEIYKEMPPGSTESYTYQQILSYLGRQDPEAAIKEALLAKTPQEQSQAISSALSEMAQTDPQAAIRQLAGIPAGGVRDRAIASLASSWGSSDPTAALAWANTLDSATKASAITSILPSMAQSDPQGAADILGTMLANAGKDSNGTLSNTASSIVQSWGREDPQAAANWITSLGNDNLARGSISTLMYSWARSDLDGAGAWANSQPAGASRDSAFAALSNGLESRDPALAFQWASNIGNDQQRSSSMMNILANWRQNDPDGARSALEKANIPEQDRTRYLQMFGFNRDASRTITTSADEYEDSSLDGN